MYKNCEKIGVLQYVRLTTLVAIVALSVILGPSTAKADSAKQLDVFAHGDLHVFCDKMEVDWTVAEIEVFEVSEEELLGEGEDPNDWTFDKRYSFFETASDSENKNFFISGLSNGCVLGVSASSVSIWNYELFLMALREAVGGGSSWAETHNRLIMKYQTGDLNSDEVLLATFVLSVNGYSEFKQLLLVQGELLGASYSLGSEWRSMSILRH